MKEDVEGTGKGQGNRDLYVGREGRLVPSSIAGAYRGDREGSLNRFGNRKETSAESPQNSQTGTKELCQSASSIENQLQSLVRCSHA